MSKEEPGGFLLQGHSHRGTTSPFAWDRGREEGSTAAMQVIRLLNDGIELMGSGAITLPRPEKELLITIRTGNYGALDRVLNLAKQLFAELDNAETESRLPEKVDKTQISAVVSRTYLSFWNRQACAKNVTAPDAQRLITEASHVLNKQQFAIAERQWRRIQGGS